MNEGQVLNRHRLHAVDKSRDMKPYWHEHLDSVTDGTDLWTQDTTGQDLDYPTISTTVFKLCSAHGIVYSKFKRTTPLNGKQWGQPGLNMCSIGYSFEG